MDNNSDSETTSANQTDQSAIDALGGETPRVQVVRYRPGAWFWWCLPVLLLAVAAVGYLLGMGSTPPASPAEQLDAMREEFSQDRMEELRAELTELRLAQTADVGANDEVRANFRKLQSEIASLEEEVAFYRSLMAPEELTKGLHIEKMNLSPTGRPSVFGYELVIAQTVTRHAWQEGELYYEVHGAVNGERVVLALTEIADIPEYPLNFKFRYFQNYSGEFELPGDFVPETVIVTLDRGKAGEIVQQRYDWSV